MCYNNHGWFGLSVIQAVLYHFSHCTGTVELLQQNNKLELCSAKLKLSELD